MTTLVAIHEIHRPGENGKSEVIAPGKPFTASDEEVKFFVEQANAARLPFENEKLSLPKPAAKQEPVDISKLNKADLTKLATDLELTVDPKWTNAQLVEAITAKKSASSDEMI